MQREESVQAIKENHIRIYLILKNGILITLGILLLAEIYMLPIPIDLEVKELVLVEQLAEFNIAEVIKNVYLVAALCSLTVGCIGLTGVLRMNKFLMTIYQIVFFPLMMAHASAFILFMARKSEAE
jgi:hypothetical protein